MSAVGTTLLHSPGWRECRRHEQNPGYAQTTNNMSSVGAALSARASEFIGLGVPPRWGSKNVWKQQTQGLRPGLCGSIALKGSSTTNSKSMSVRRTYFSKYAYLPKCLRVLISVSARTYPSVYVYLSQ